MDQALDIGLVGLGVMGRNLGLNMMDRGFKVGGFDAAAGAREAAAKDGIFAAQSIPDLVARLRQPRLVLVMVPAGDVDDALQELEPLLEAGDVAIDGGNTHWRDTARRAHAAAERGIRYLGVGISGGEEGARHGPAIMAGGAPEGWEIARPLLEAIAALAGGRPCCAYLGPGGTGHFVKMVHNGIEYAAMQLIAESYAALRRLCGLSPSTIADIVGGWRQGERASFLLEITERILRVTDGPAGPPLVDAILDKAEQKGTGAWASMTAIDLGVPAPTLIEAAQARSLSALKDLRVELAAKGGARPRDVTPPDPAAVGAALFAATLAAYAQGFLLLAEGAALLEAPIDQALVARTWQGGCIIRAQLLETIERACTRAPGLRTLLESDAVLDLVDQHAQALRGFIATCALSGLAAPAHASALAWLDGITTERLPADLVQAQRDLFGAHRFERIDRTGRFHHDWGSP